jgi:type II secretion system protein D
MSFHRSFILFFLAWLPVAAQQPTPEAPPGVLIPGAVPVPAAGRPAAGRPTVNDAAPAPGADLRNTKIVEDIIEKKLTGDALAGLYRRYTGRRIIVTTGAAAAEFSFVQEASAQDPLTYAEAAELLRKAAVLEGFVFSQHPQDSNLDILTLATGGPRPTNVSVDVYNENSTLPDTDVVITYVMALSYIKPDQAVNIFTQIIGQFGAYGSISSVANASAVVITEKASLIKSLIELQKTIDVPGSVQATRFIKVQYADVTEIATVLTELLTAQQGAEKTAGVQRAAIPGTPPGVAPAGQAGDGASSGEDTPVQIIPEPRTNRIFAMGRPVDLVFVENLVREFDVPTSDKTFLRRKLRFLTVSEFLPIAGNALTRAFTGTGEGGSGGGGGASGGAGGQTAPRTQQSSARQTGSGSSSRNSSSGFGGNSSSGFGGSSGGFGGSSGGGFGGGSGGGGGLSDPSVSSAPESLLVGRTLLVADNITNSIVAQGPPSALEIIERLLDQIDVKPDQVMISTVIGQLTLGKGIETGMDYLYRGGDIAGRAGGGFGALLPILNYIPGLDAIPGIPGSPANPGSDGIPSVGVPGEPGYIPGTAAVAPVPAVPSVPGRAAVPAQGEPFAPGSLSGAGFRAYGQIGDLSVFLKAVQTRSDFTVLSRPSIFTSNNQKGVISSGERIAIPTGSNSYGGGGVNGSVSTQIEYQDVVLKLEVIPLVNSDNEITMQIALLNDEQNGTQTIQGGAGGEDLTVPRISTREILTTATVPNNNTIVLGGLIVNRDGQEKSGIPILSDIPYLGRLFSSTKDTNDRSELMVFIQPSIVNNDRTLNDVQADMDGRYKVSPKARDFADGDGVLPGVDEIPQVQEKGKGGSRKADVPATKKKSSIRPHRR